MVAAPITTRLLCGPDFDAPIDDRWLADYRPGSVYEYGHLEVTEDEILEFAGRFDRQRIHTDPRWAATGPFAGLIASGWHSAALAMRLLGDHYISAVAGLASPGVDELRWAAPLRPGDNVRLRATVLETRPSRSKADRGMVHTLAELLNQDDRCPISFRAMDIIASRPSARRRPA